MRANSVLSSADCLWQFIYVFKTNRFPMKSVYYAEKCFFFYENKVAFVWKRFVQSTHINCRRQTFDNDTELVPSDNTWLFACWVIFSNICFFQNFQKIHCFHPFFRWYIIWMSNNLDLRWSPTFCGASSGSKLFAKGHQRSSKFTASGLRVK